MYTESIFIAEVIFHQRKVNERHFAMKYSYFDSSAGFREKI